MSPATTVSNIAHQSRLNGERLIAPVVVSEYPQHRPDNETPVMPHATPRVPAAASALLDDRNVKLLREQNTKQLLKSNYWFEIASISRWCTTGLIGLTMFTIVNAAGWGAAALPGSFSAIATGLGTAFFGAAAAPVWGALAALAIAATVTVKASQHSRKVFVEKSFDVQDTLMQRQAQLVGKSVEQAVAPQEAAPSRQRWVERTQASLEAAEGQQVAR